MEEGDEGRLDVCCLDAARSSQLGRVSGCGADWLMICTTAIRSERSHLRRIRSKTSDVFLWGMEWHLANAQLENTKSCYVHWDLIRRRFYTESSFPVTFKWTTLIPVPESCNSRSFFFLHSNLRHTHLHVHDGLSAAVQTNLPVTGRTHAPH